MTPPFPAYRPMSVKRQILMVAIPLVVGSVFTWAVAHFVNQTYVLTTIGGGIVFALIWMVIDGQRSAKRLSVELDALHAMINRGGPGQ